MLKTRISVFAVITFFLFLIAFCSVCFALETNNEKIIAIKAKWFESVSGDVQKMNDSQASEIFHFLKENSIAAAPEEKGVRFLQGAKNDSWIGFIALQKGDENVSEHWRVIFTASAAANFLPEVRTMIVKDFVPYSHNGKAIAFLHEGLHAYLFVKNPYEGRQDDRDYCHEEVTVHTFQNRVMGLLGGKKYQEALDKEVLRIETEGSKSSNGDLSIPGRREHYPDLAKALGKPASKAEEDFIATSIWINAVFVFMEKNYKGDATEQKALFLRSIYKKEGII